MNKLSTAKRVQIISALVEGNSIRATCRMTGAAKGTVLKLLKDIGRACEFFSNDALVGLPCKRLQCDEIWTFCHAKQRNVPAEKVGILGYGDVWTWTAICADTKLAVGWLVGRRDEETATQFMSDVASRLANRVQLTTDGHHAYLSAVDTAFGGEVDFAQLIKIYTSDRASEARYSPPKCSGARRQAVSGTPDGAHISMSFVERQNLTMRMGCRRFTRLTNAFSKNVYNLMDAVALHFTYYNFCRVHQTLKQTPAMAAGVADHVWSLRELVGLLGSN
jgi:IS1 family transposase